MNLPPKADYLYHNYTTYISLSKARFIAKKGTKYTGLVHTYRAFFIGALKDERC
jgi:hypothetical protein